MKKLFVLITVIMATMSLNSFAVEVIAAPFGTVPQGQSKTITFELKAGLFTITADTPFDIQTVAPFLVNPSSGTLRRIRGTPVTVTLPGTAAPGDYNVNLILTVHRNSGNATFNIPATAKVVGPVFPFKLNPAELQFGNVEPLANPTLQVTITDSAGFLPNTFTTHATSPFTVSPASGVILASHSANITIGIDPAAPLGTSSGKITITDPKTGLKENVDVVAKIVFQKPDLIATITNVSITAGNGGFKVFVSFSIRNVGTVTSSACAGKIILDVDNKVDFTIDSLPPEGLANIQPQSFTTTLTGSHTLKVDVDTGNQNNEIDEINNETTQVINIQ